MARLARSLGKPLESKNAVRAGILIASLGSFRSPDAAVDQSGGASQTSAPVTVLSLVAFGWHS